jgi:hypothetical protein
MPASSLFVDTDDVIETVGVESLSWQFVGICLGGYRWLRRGRSRLLVAEVRRRGCL